MGIGDKKQQILEAATKLFSAHGMGNTNVRQIALEAKSNSALIFYYFGCKEKLFFECMATMASERLKMAKEVLSAPQDRRDFEVKLEIFVSNMMSVCESKKDLMKLLHRELDNSNPRAAKIFQNHFLPVAETLCEFFTLAQEKKIIKDSVNARFLTMDFFALMFNHVRNESVLKIFLKSSGGTSSSQDYTAVNGKRIIDLVLKGVE